MRGGSLLLVALSTVAIGYANWDVGPKLASLFPSDDISADEAIDARVFSSPSISMFVSSPSGIKDESDPSARILTGSITISFSIHCAYLKESGYLSSGNLFSFTSSLRPDNASFLSSVTGISCPSADSISEGSKIDGALRHTLSVSLTDADDISLTLVYSVIDGYLSDGSYIASRGYIYSTFGDMAIAFSLEAVKAS